LEVRFVNSPAIQRVIMTMKAPVWYYKLVYGAPVDKSFVNTTLKFCGVGPVRVTRIGALENLNDNKRELLLGKVENLGRTLE
jgi:NAD(P)H dehydrogenase (quinone)